VQGEQRGGEGGQAGGSSVSMIRRSGAGGKARHFLARLLLICATGSASEAASMRDERRAH